MAIQNGHADVVDFLLENGADVTQVCNGLTPLEKAKQQGHDEIIGVVDYYIGLLESQPEKTLKRTPKGLRRIPVSQKRLASAKHFASQDEAPGSSWCRP